MSSAAALPILMYHHVSPRPGLVTVSPSVFRQQMQSLAEAGWRTVGLGEVERFFAGQPIPAKTCIVTFDDGYLDNMVYAAPVLSEFAQHAVVFVATSWMGDGPPRSGLQETPDHRECKRRIATGDADSVILRWSEAEHLQMAGVFEFHSHTHTHCRWDKTVGDPSARAAALAEDLHSSQRALVERLGITSRHLCWPQGYYDPQYVETANACGFDHLYTTEVRINLPLAPVSRIGRFVTKDKPGSWLLRRARLYANPLLGGLYCRLRAS